MEKLKIPYPILVEGKYDKIKLESILDANIKTAGGFSLFNNEEKMALLKRITEKNGLGTKPPVHLQAPLYKGYKYPHE